MMEIQQTLPIEQCPDKQATAFLTVLFKNMMTNQGAQKLEKDFKEKDVYQD